MALVMLLCALPLHAFADMDMQEEGAQTQVTDSLEEENVLDEEENGESKLEEESVVDSEQDSKNINQEEQTQEADLIASAEDSTPATDAVAMSYEEIQQSILEQAKKFQNSKKNSGVTNDLTTDVISTLLKSALSTMASKGGDKLGNLAADKIMSTIFGTQQSETQQLLDAIDMANQKQDEAIALLNKVVSLLKNASTLDALNSMMQVASGASTSLFSDTETYMDAMQEAEADKYTSKSKENQRKNILVWGIGEVGSSTLATEIIKLNKISSYDAAVMEFGKKILFNYLLLDNTRQPALNLMNVYDPQVNKWENQGYEQREIYWNALINLYLSAAALDKSSLLARIDVYQKTIDPENPPNILQTRLDTLNKQIPMIQALAEETAVTRLASYLRHYQVPGHEFYMYTNAVKDNLSGIFGKTTREDYKSSSSDTIPSHWNPLFTSKGFPYGKKALSASYYQTVYDDYNPAGTSKKKSLYEIFFGEDEGNLSAPSGMGNNPLFVSSTVYTKEDKIKGWYSTYYILVGCTLFENDASHPVWETKKLVTNLIGGSNTVISYRHYTTQYSEAKNKDKIEHIPTSYRNRFVMIAFADESDVPTEANTTWPDTHELKDELYYDSVSHWQKCVEDHVVNRAYHELTFQQDASFHWQTCYCECGYTTEKEAHSYGKWNVVQEATEKEKGLSERSCTICNYKDTIETTIDDEKDGKSPKTGENNPLALWITLFFVGVATAVGSRSAVKKKEQPMA